ncbi:TonB-dependent receptor [Leptolyngbya sp. 15MV]|nr:TonB-dependent receptor [Leptolyngbya sp. 15MV]
MGPPPWPGSAQLGVVAEAISDPRLGPDQRRGGSELLAQMPDIDAQILRVLDMRRPPDAVAVLANDTDPQNDALSIQSFTQPSAGLVTLSGNQLVFATDGAFESLGAGQSTTVSYSYTIADGRGGSDTATVTITVTGVNDGPSAEDKAVSVIEDDAIMGEAAGDLLDGATDPDAGDTLTVVAVNGGTSTTVEGTYGTLTWESGGGFTYTLDDARAPTDALAQDEEVTETFDFTVSDGNGGSVTRTLTVTVIGTNDAPVAADATLTVAEDGTIAGTVEDLISDVDNALLSIEFVGPGVPGLSRDSSGGWIYTPPADFNGTVSFQYRANDGAADSNIGTVTINVTPVNDAPTDIGLSNASVAENSAVGTLVGLLSATDVDGGPASFSIVGGPGPFAINGNRLEVAGALDFETQATYSVTVRADDGAGGTYDETFVIAVEDVDEGGGNVPPVVGDDSETVAEDGVLNGTVAGLASDGDGDALTFALVGGAPVGLTFNVDGTYSYAPPADFNGSVSFQYRANDGAAFSNVGTVSIVVTPVNDGPTAVADFATGVAIVTTDELTAVDIPFTALLANDFHVDGTSFTLTSLGADFRGAAVLVDTDDDTVLDAVRFTPDVQNGNFTEFSNSWLGHFYYTITDADGDTSTTYAYVRINDVNQAVAANDDTLARQPSPHVISFAALFGNDTDLDSPEAGWTITGISNASGVTAVVDNDARTISITYESEFEGTYGFDYTVDDGEGGSDTARVILDTAPAQTGPVGTLVLDEDVPQYVADDVLIALAGVTDADGDTLFVISPVAGANLVTFDAGGSVYVGNADADWNGGSTLTFTVSDGHPGGQITVTIPVTINPVNDAPRDPQGNDAALGLTTAEDTPLVIPIAALLADDLNPADETQVVTLHDLSNWAYGTVVNNNDGTLTFTPDEDFNGSTGFWYRAKDERPGTEGVGNYVWVPVTVTAVDDPVVANDDVIAREFLMSGTQRIAFSALLATAGNQLLQQRDVAFDEITGRAVLDFKITPDNLLYASYSRGYKSGGINPPLQPIFAVPESFGSETIDAFEIGLKNNFFNGMLQVNLTGFYYNYKDLQLSRIIARTSVNDTVDARIWGLELESIIRPADNWLVNMNLSYLNARVKGDQFFSDPRDPGGGDPNAVIIKDITNGAHCAVTSALGSAGANGFVAGVNAALGLQAPTPFPSDSNIASTGAFSICNVLSAQAAAPANAALGITVLSPGVEVNIRGNHLPQAPEYKASVGVQYTAEFGGGMSLVPRFDLAMTGQQYGNIFNGRINRIEPFVQANAQIQLNGPDSKWYVRGFIQNIFDSNSTTGLYVTDASSGLFTNIFTLDPRRYGIAVGAKF